MSWTELLLGGQRARVRLRVVLDEVVRDVGGGAGMAVLSRVVGLGAGLLLTGGVGRGPWVAAEVP